MGLNRAFPGKFCKTEGKGGQQFLALLTVKQSNYLEAKIISFHEDSFFRRRTGEFQLKRRTSGNPRLGSNRVEIDKKNL
jgi:hypothetical protein